LIQYHVVELEQHHYLLLASNSMLLSTAQLSRNYLKTSILGRRRRQPWVSRTAPSQVICV